MSFKSEIEKLASKAERKNAMRDLAAGALAGLTASYSTYPVDTISNIKQFQPGRSIKGIVQDLYSEGKNLASEGKLFAKSTPKLNELGEQVLEKGKPIYEPIANSRAIARAFTKYPRLGGISHFYGGAGVKVFKIAPYTALSFALYQAIKNKMEKSDAAKNKPQQS